VKGCLKGQLNLSNFNRPKKKFLKVIFFDSFGHVLTEKIFSQLYHLFPRSYFTENNQGWPNFQSPVFMNILGGGGRWGGLKFIETGFSAESYLFSQYCSAHAAIFALKTFCFVFWSALKGQGLATTSEGL
jgi:hypothetical protein